MSVLHRQPRRPSHARWMARSPLLITSSPATRSVRALRPSQLGLPLSGITRLGLPAGSLPLHLKLIANSHPSGITRSQMQAASLPSPLQPAANSHPSGRVRTQVEMLSPPSSSQQESRPSGSGRSQMQVLFEACISWLISRRSKQTHLPASALAMLPHIFVLPLLDFPRLVRVGAT